MTSSPGIPSFLVLVASLLLPTSSHRLAAADPEPVARWNFDTEEPTPLVARGGVVRDQIGPRPPEFPSLGRDNMAVRLPGDGARFEIKDTGAKSPYDFTNGDAITVEAWVQVETLRPGQQAYVVGKGRTHSPRFSKDNQNWSLRVVGARSGLAQLGFLFTSQLPGAKPRWHRWTSDAAFDIASGWHHVALAYEFGRPETMRGWIDGLPTEGKWDADGPTGDPPVDDDDDVWIGSSLNGSPYNSLQGMIDMVAIHRRLLSDEAVAGHFLRKDGPRVVLPGKATMPDLGEIESGKVLVQFSEELPTYERWPSAVEQPEETERWLGETFLLPRVPQRYDAWGIRSAWKAPLLVRIAADVELPGGTRRYLVRARALARLWIDGKLVAETRPADGSTPNGHESVTPLAAPPHPGLRVKDYHHQEVFGTASGKGKGTSGSSSNWSSAERTSAPRPARSASRSSRPTALPSPSSAPPVRPSSP